MDTHSTNSHLTQFPQSLWLKQSVPSYPSLTENKTAEVGVIGGGIVGIITAYLLAKAGKKVTLIEARDILSGVTGNTTAKISAQHGLIYNELINTFGEKKARLYYEANRDGLNLIKDISESLSIECDFETRDASVFSTSSKGKKQIEKESQAYQKLLIDGTLTNGQVDELPFETTAALTMPKQAQFHPVKFLAPLLKEIEKLGGEIYENTRAVKVCKGKMRVHLENGSSLDCEKVVVATHYPFNDFNGLYFSKLSIERSYLLAAKVNNPVPQGMYISAESPSRSLRSARSESGEEYLLIGGDGHQSGKSHTHTNVHYRNLENFGKAWFDLQNAPYHWSAQDLTTLDKVPYIGQMTRSSENIFVATGFNKWGMAMGATAGQLFTDMILNRDNQYSDLFDPTRNKLKGKDLQQFTKKNVAVGKDFVVKHAKRPDKAAENLAIDEGGLVTVNGKKVGGYRDSDGQLHLVKTNCTHMGCGLDWNDAERSWDCSCHGSRFSYKGDVLDGPAVKPLEKIEE